jgi:hypothetical protein
MGDVVAEDPGHSTDASTTKARRRPAVLSGLLERTGSDP